MAYLIAQNIKECKAQLSELVKSFASGITDFKTKNYSEAQLRIDYLNPLLKCFGWDVDNETQKTQYLRDVIQEESIDVREEDKITKKNPDYTLKLYGSRCLFVEAKKASMDITNSDASAFQTRRYGWSGNLGISILTNFEYIIIYDCRFKPSPDDTANVARYKIFHFSDFLNQIEELYQYLSYDSIESGYLERAFPNDIKGGESFDDHFLNQIENWRASLAKNVVANNAKINHDDINFLVQRLINRIIFLRICEDREIEKFETLKSIQTYEALKELFSFSDEKYNSGLFNFIENDLTHQITIDDGILINIFTDLYYPISPYDFTVIDPAVLSQIYERYLGNKIVLSTAKSISIVSEPEVVASNGVVPTPKRIVKQIVEETLNPIFDQISFEKSLCLKIADICCGSGTFLISAFDYLAEKRASTYMAGVENDGTEIIQTAPNQWRLSLEEKHKIICSNIYGVDMNPYAVEVAQFSLLLKIIEGENNASIEAYLNKTRAKVLPNLDNNIKCGNALLDNNYFTFNEGALEDDNLLFRLNPFNWVEEFPFLEKNQGFDVIIGNPPYVRIQNFIKYSLEEVEYYRSKESPYSVSKKDTYDKYYLFIERAISLLCTGGRLGYIVPHKFFIAKGGQKLRKSITQRASLEKIIHFGVTQIFPDRSTYTAILVLHKGKSEFVSFKRIDDLSKLDIFEKTPAIRYSNADFASLPWVFVSEPALQLFQKITSKDTTPLKAIAEIPVGLQTSADKIYIFKPIDEDDYHFIFKKDGIICKVEKNICLPCLYDASFRLFDTLTANTQIIFPYQITNNTASVISEVQLQNDYPNCWEYLNRYKSKLEKRSINGGNPMWYQYGRSQSLSKFHNTEKIIFPVLSKESSYAVDFNNIQFTGGGNGPYYSIIPNSSYSIYYLLGLLSHPVLEAMVKSRASEFRGEYYSHGKQYIENIPIRIIDFDDSFQKGIHDTISGLVQQLISTKENIKRASNYQKKKVLERKIAVVNTNLMNMINELYNFSNKDIESITGNNLFVTQIDQ